MLGIVVVRKLLTVLNVSLLFDLDMKKLLLKEVQETTWNCLQQHVEQTLNGIKSDKTKITLLRVISTMKVMKKRFMKCVNKSPFKQSQIISFTRTRKAKA